MSEPYLIYGAEMSPYSVKVRSYFRFKGIPHRWLPRNADTMADYQKHAKLPIVPLVVTPEDEGVQDSTPIIERLEASFREPSIHPEDPTLRFVSELLEEFGDEWGNKWMFHYRWARSVDQESCAGRIARGAMPRADESQHAAMAAQVRERMVGRVWFVGSSEQTAPQIEASFAETLELLETHLAGRPYLMGARPCFGDFGLWGQIYNAWTDPTPGALVESRAPAVLEWCQRMLFPRVEGEFESWESLSPTLMPLIDQQVGRLFVPWTLANAQAIEQGQEEFSVELAGQTWSQKPQKYHAKSLRALFEKYAKLEDRRQVDGILECARCLDAFSGAAG